MSSVGNSYHVLLDGVPALIDHSGFFGCGERDLSAKGEGGQLWVGRQQRGVRQLKRLAQLRENVTYLDCEVGRKRSLSVRRHLPQHRVQKEQRNGHSASDEGPTNGVLQALLEVL